MSGARTDSSKLLASAEPAWVNVGLVRWNEQRKVWLAPRPRAGKVATRPKIIPLSVSVVTALVEDMDRVRELPAPVPLPQMVDILVDMWEEEGLFD